VQTQASTDLVGLLLDLFSALARVVEGELVRVEEEEVVVFQRVLQVLLADLLDLLVELALDFPE